MEIRLDSFALRGHGNNARVAFEANGNETGRGGAVSHGHRVADRAESVGVLGDLKDSLADGALVVPVRDLHACHGEDGEREQERKTTANWRQTLHSVT